MFLLIESSIKIGWILLELLVVYERWECTSRALGYSDPEAMLDVWYLGRNSQIRSSGTADDDGNIWGNMAR